MIKPGMLCRIEANCTSYNGEMVEYLGEFHGSYEFLTANNSKIRLYSDAAFMVLPDEQGIKELIELALSAKDKVWFQELVEQLQFMKRYKAAKGIK